MGEYSRGHWLAIRDNGGSLTKFYRARAQYAHVSANARMVRLPDADNPEQVITSPYVQCPGVTLDLGRNAAKRERRAAR